MGATSSGGPLDVGGAHGVGFNELGPPQITPHRYRVDPKGTNAQLVGRVNPNGAPSTSASEHLGETLRFASAAVAAQDPTPAQPTGAFDPLDERCGGQPARGGSAGSATGPGSARSWKQRWAILRRYGGGHNLLVPGHQWRCTRRHAPTRPGGGNGVVAATWWTSQRERPQRKEQGLPR